MINFEQHNKVLQDALTANKKLLESSQRNLNEINAKILQNKDKFTSDQLTAFEDAMKEAEKMKTELKKHGVKHTK